MLVHALLLVLLAACALSDGLAYRIPNLLPLAVAGLFVAASLAAGEPSRLVPHLAIGGAVLAAGFLLFMLRALGGGDAKLLAATAVWAGPELLPAHLLVTALAGVALAAALVAGRHLWALAARHAPARLAGVATPRILQPDDRIPYGIAVAASAALVSFRVPPSTWPL